MDYIETVKYLIQNINLDEDKIYQYKGEAGEEYFDKLFSFYMDNLNYNKDFGANPSFIIFHNRGEIYAGAKKSKNHYVIIFDKGIINQLSMWYGLYFDFGNINGLEEFLQIEEEIKFPISTLMEQAIVHYTFYHEFAHLIQYVDESEFERKDYLFGNCNYERDRHIEEYDADIFSGMCLATHIYQFVNSKLGQNLDKDKLNDFIAITIAGVMSYILSLPMCKEGFYTHESSHPHNSIRVNYVNMAIIQHFVEIVSQEGNKIKIDEEYINGKSFIILNNLLTHFGLDDVKQRFYADMRDNWESIQSYQKQLHKLFLNYQMSAVNKWNEK